MRVARRPVSPAGREALHLLGRELDAPTGLLDEAAGAGGAPTPEVVREAARCLILLDNEVRGPVAELAACTFLGVRRRIARAESGGEPASRELLAAVAELGEVAGWALFEAERHRASLRLASEGLRLAWRAGDVPMALLILQNLALQAGWTGRPHTELRLAEAVLARHRLSPRVEALFRTRRARGLVLTGHVVDGDREFDRARGLLGESGDGDEPPWAWWVSDGEIRGHRGFVRQQTGEDEDWAASVADLLAATDRSGLGYQSLYVGRLLAAALRLGSTQDALYWGESALREAPEAASLRARNLVRRTARRGEQRPGASRAVREVLHAVGEALDEGE